MATHILTVGAVIREALQTFAFTGAGPYTCTNDGAPSHTVVVGDTVIDTNGDEYLITVVTSQIVYTVTDYKGLGAPNDGTTDGSVGRSADKLSSAEDDIPDYQASIGSSDTVEWRCYDDSSAMDDKLVFSDVNLGTSATLKITAPNGERNTGTAGTGFTIDPGTAGFAIMLDGLAGTPNITIEFIEITGWDGENKTAVRDICREAGSVTEINGCIFHDPAGVTGNQRGIEVSTSTGDLEGQHRVVKIINTLIYDCGNIGINIQVDRPGVQILNCVTINNSYGVFEALEGDDTALVQNCASFDNATLNFRGTSWHADSGYNASNTATSDVNYPGGTTSNNVGSLTSSNEFVDLTDGAEIFNLKKASSLVDSGTSLTSTFTTDINGHTRETVWDIGAFARATYTSFIRTVGGATADESKTALTITPTSTPNEWTVTMSASLTLTPVTGDRLLIGTDHWVVVSATSNTVFIIRDDTYLGVPPTLGGGDITVGRSDPNLTDAEADIVNYGASGDSVELRLYDDGDFTGSTVWNDTTLGTSGSLTITAPPGERHNGAVGNGVVMDPTDANATIWTFSTGTGHPDTTISFLQLTGWGSTSGNKYAMLFSGDDTGQTIIVDSCIIHDDVAGGGTPNGIATNGEGTLIVRNCLVYDVTTNGLWMTGMLAKTVENCTVHNCGTGIRTVDAGTLVRNTASFSGSGDNYVGTFSSSSDFNASDTAAASMPGGDTGNNLGGLTEADHVVLLTDGAEIFNLKKASSLVDAGTNLSSTFTTDINGHTRETVWDIGAFARATYTSFVRTVGGATLDASKTALSVTPTSTPNEWTVTMSASLTLVPVAGDQFLIGTDIWVVVSATNNTVFIIRDDTYLGVPPTLGGGDISVGRYDATIVDAEADLGLYGSTGDTVELRLYADGLFDTANTFNNAVLGTTGTLIITAIPGERHTGTAGTGVVINPGGDGDVFQIRTASAPATTISHLEMTGFTGSAGSIAGVRIRTVAAGVIQTIDSCIIHDDDLTTQLGIWVSDATATVNIRNSIFYDTSQGLHLSSPNVTVENCTIVSCENDGIRLGGTTDVLVRNSAIFDNSTNFTGTFSSSSDFNASDTAASLMPGGDTGNNLGGLTEADHVVLLTDGSENFRLKSTSNLKDAGTDLSSTFTRDVIGNIRGLNSSWDIGAFDWDTVSATIGSASGTGVTISTVVGESPEWTLTLSAAAPADLIAGQKINDGTTDFLVRSVSGTTVVVRRVAFNTVVDPVAGVATTLRYDTDLSDAEAVIGNIVEAGNGLTWLCMNDSSGLDDKLTMDNVTLGISGLLTITSPVGERHTGDAGSGFVINPSGAGDVIVLSGSSLPSIVIEFLEITGWSIASGVSYAINEGHTTTSGTDRVSDCIIHDDSGGGGTPRGMTTNNNRRATTLRNLLMYDINHVIMECIAPNGMDVHNCVIRNGGSAGIGDSGTGRTVDIVNCAVFDNVANFSGASLTGSNNASEDDEGDIPGGEGVGNVGSLAAANSFRDLTDGSEDYRTKGGSALRDNGADLSATFTLDIISATRTPPFDIGAFQFTGAGWLVPAILGG